jgi:hypothetical protein
MLDEARRESKRGTFVGLEMAPVNAPLCLTVLSYWFERNKEYVS